MLGISFLNQSKFIFYFKNLLQISEILKYYRIWNEKKILISPEFREYQLQFYLFSQINTLNIINIDF